MNKDREMTMALRMSRARWVANVVAFRSAPYGTIVMHAGSLWAIKFPRPSYPSTR